MSEKECLRAFLAAMAMNAIIPVDPDKLPIDTIVKVAVQMADQLIEELGKKDE